MRDIGDRVGVLINEKAMTQGAFAEKIHTSTGLVNGWINGRGTPGLDSIMEICIAFCVSADWLLFEKGDMYW